MLSFLHYNQIMFFVLLQSMVFCCAAAADTLRPSTSEGRPGYCGVWGIWGGEQVSTEGRPWFKGVVVTSEWNRIELRPGEFSWDALDRKVREVVDKGLTVMIMIYRGLMFKGPNPQSNDWLMEHLPDFWRKPHMIAQGYQFNNELRVMDELYPRTRQRIDGVLIRPRILPCGGQECDVLPDRKISSSRRFLNRSTHHE